MKRNTFVLLMLSIVMVFTFTSCGNHMVEPGYVGVKVKSMGSNKGIQKEVLPPGRYFPTLNEDIYDFPTFKVNYVFCRDTTESSPTNEEFTFQTIEGMECSMDLGVTLYFVREKVSDMYQTYMMGVEEIRAVVVRKEVRDAVNRVGGLMPVESVYGAGKGMLIDTVLQIAAAKLAPTGIVLESVSLIGSIRIPTSVTDALNAKVVMNQEAERARNEIAKAQAIAEKRIVEAKGVAEANLIESNSLTDKILMRQWIEAWKAGGSPVPNVIDSGPTMYQLPNFNK